MSKFTHLKPRRFVAAFLCAAASVCAQVHLAADLSQQTQGEPSHAPAPMGAKGGALLDATVAAFTPAREPEPPAQAAAWLRQINALRAAGANCGGQRFEPAPPLRWHLLLEQAAVLHTREQAARNNLTHDGADGSSVGERMNRQGYSWQGAAENVAAGQADMAAAITGWLNSPGHCRNLMGPGYNDVAVAQAPASGMYRTYYTMVLGKRGGGSAPPLNAELAQVRDPKATLAFINNLRAQGGTCGKTTFLPSRPLEWDERVVRVAQWDALESQGRRAADDPVDSASRFRAAGYIEGRSTVMRGGGGPGPLVAVNGFWGGERQCAALFDDSYRHVGVAGAQDQSQARSSPWRWSLVLANPMYGDRIGEAGPVDRTRHDRAVALEVVNHFRARGLTCKGEVMPPVPPVQTHPALEAVIQAVPDGPEGRSLEWATLLRRAGVDWPGSSTEFSGGGSHGPAIAMEDWVTDTYCKELLSPKLKYLGARLVALSAGAEPSYWYLIAVNGK